MLSLVGRMVEDIFVFEVKRRKKCCRAAPQHRKWPNHRLAHGLCAPAKIRVKIESCCAVARAKLRNIAASRVRKVIGNGTNTPASDPKLKGI